MNNAVGFRAAVRPRHWVFVLGAGALVVLFIGVKHLLYPADLRLTSLKDIVQVELRLQIVFALGAVGYLYLLRRFHPERFQFFDAAGNLRARADAAPLFGIRRGDSWLHIGAGTALISLTLTGLYAYVQMLNRTLPAPEVMIPSMLFAALLAAGSAFTVTAITRFGLVVCLHRTIPNGLICLVSALVFGLPQVFALQSGWLSALLACLIGWLATRSILETRGTVWAWMLQFSRDWVLYTALLSMLR
ncbi:MAG: hypothetical protein SF162_03950 [bacterium]|nr:hypothetical protein [bacterium]